MKAYDLREAEDRMAAKQMAAGADVPTAGDCLLHFPARGRENDHYEMRVSGRWYARWPGFEWTPARPGWEPEATDAARTLGARGGAAGTGAAKSRGDSEHYRRMAKATVHTYYLLSGEGEAGTWQGPIRTTARGIRARRARECAGGRWCSAWILVPETYTTRAHISDIDSGDVREVPCDTRA